MTGLTGLTCRHCGAPLDVDQSTTTPRYVDARSGGTCPRAVDGQHRPAPRTTPPPCHDCRADGDPWCHDCDQCNPDGQYLPTGRLDPAYA